MSIFAGKTLMITGGTGSFGNAVLNRFLRTDIGEIRIFSRDEKKQDDMRHGYRGFFVVYSLRLHRAYKVCVLIPTPKVEYLAACMELRKITSQNPISVKCLPQLDYLQDKGAILRLKDWCYGWQVDL